MSAAKEEDASMTIGDLSADTGLLEITCSGLMSSTDHDISICSCHGDQVEYCRVADTVAAIVDGQKESVQLSNQHAVNSDNICSPVPESNKEVPPGTPENRMETVGDGAEASNERHVSFRGNISLFNDTSVNMSRLMSRLNDLNEKNESTLGSINYSYADSTRFYSLGVGNLHDLLGKEELESDEEHGNQDEDGSMTSVNGVEINEDSVSFKTSKNYQEHPFLKSNGDLNTDRIHEQAVIIERNLKNNEISVEALVEALENSLTDRCEKDEEIEALKAEVKNLQEQLQQSGAAAERRSVTPSVEAVSSEDDKSATELEDLKLQVANLEKKLEIERKYLETQTAERELERDDFQKTITELSTKIDDMRREKEHLDIIISNQKTEVEDYEVRLRDIVEMQSEAQTRNERYEEELKSAVDKIQELRSIIRELEDQIDIATKNATDLKEQNQFLQENLEQMEKMKEDPAVEEDEKAIAADANIDLTEELHAQVDDLARRLERKLNDMDNFQWSTRPNSSCSNAVSVSNEDISVSRDLGYINKEQDCVDVVTLIADGLRKLDSQFESLVRFEEIIMKKLRDAELRLANLKKSQEDMDSEKHVLQEKVKNQILTISDLENRLDQLRFEPSPNTMTLSGLRARVAALNNEVEEYKGQLQLKELELQDALEKLAGKDALLSKLQQMPAVDIAVPHVKKSNIATQCAIQLRSSSTQTRDSFKTPRISTSVAVQTVVAAGVDNLEISSIQGVLPVTHSTPNEGSLVRTVARNLRKKNEVESRGVFGSQLNDHDRSPEVLRDPFASRVTQSVLSDKIPRIPDLRDLESGVLKKYESDYGDEPRGPQLGQLQERAIEREERTGRDIPAGGITDNSLASSSGSTSRVVVGTAGGDSSPAAEIKSPEGSGLGGADNRVLGAADTDGAEGVRPETNEDVRAVTPAAENVPAVPPPPPPPPAATKKPVSNSSQTPPLALANLIDALDEEEKQRLFEELRKAEGSGSMTSDEKDEEIAKLLSRIKELETVCSENKIKAAGESGGGNGGSCVIETTLDFDEAMKPVNAETRMNYVVTQPPNSVAKPCGDVDPRIISEITDIVARLGCDSTALLSMNEDQCTWVHQALTTLVQNNNPPPVPTTPPDVPSDPEDSRTFTYEMETSVDFQLSENGDLSVVGAEGKIIPSESIAKVSSGAKPLDRSRSRSRSSRINSVDRSVGSEVLEPDVDPNSSSVPWEQLQKTQEGRLNEADARVEVEVLKTKLNMMQQALEQEREKNAAVCSEQSPAFNRLNQLLVEERGKLEGLQCFVEQQNMEIASLTQQIQDMEVVCSAVGRGDAGYAVDAAPTYQTPVGLQVANRQMNVTFTRGFEGGGLACGGETLSADPSGNPATDPSTGLSSSAQPKDLGRAMSQKWYELYMRAKSYRKALAWQKKYLAVVIQGYKDLLGVSGAAFEHPDLLQKEVPITPSSVGLCDKRKGKTRFRIVGKAVLASVRMKYMVNRWTGKMCPRSMPDIQRRVGYAGSSRNASASSSSSSESDGSEMNNRRNNCDKPRTVTFSAFSPPTKDSSKTSRSAPSRSTNTGVSVGGNQRGTSSRTNKIGHPSTANQSARNPAAPIARSANSNNAQAQMSCVQEKQLSQYFERFQTLEKEIGNTISRVVAGTIATEAQQAVQK